MRSKYGAIKTTVDGIVFASKAEARRYSELKLLVKAGEIDELERQMVFNLTVYIGTDGVCSKVIGKYIADFSYFTTTHRTLVVEDVKGVSTPLYRWKKKHVEAQYGITISEIRYR